jgi:hypothetical protein
MKVMQVVQQSDAEQEFFVDAFSLFLMTWKRNYYGWPSHSRMLLVLCTLVKGELKYKEFVFVFQECGCKEEGDVKNMMQHYGRYGC